MIPEKIRIGIIGCGMISEHYARAYLKHTAADVTAVCDVVKERAEAKAAEWKAGKIYCDYRQVIEDGEIDAVGIYTRPLYQHAQIAIAAAKAKKHISCQKPISLTLSEADELVKVVREADVKFQYSEPDVWIPTWMEAKRMIDSGEIGEPKQIRVTNHPDSLRGIAERKRDPQQERAFSLRIKEIRRLQEQYPVLRERMGDLETYGLSIPYIDHVVHWMAVVHYLMGPVEKVGCMMEFDGNSDPLHPIGINKTPAMMWKHRDKRRYGVQIGEGTLDMPGKRIAIVGTRGTLYVNDYLGGRNALTLHQDERRIINIHIPRNNYWMPTFETMANNFVDSILKDKEPRLSVEDGRNILRFAIGAGKAAKEGIIVDLEFIDK